MQIWRGFGTAPVAAPGRLKWLYWRAKEALNFSAAAKTVVGARASRARTSAMKRRDMVQKKVRK